MNHWWRWWRWPAVSVEIYHLRALEGLLAILYTDAQAREVFRLHPQMFAEAYGIDRVTALGLQNADFSGIEFAAASIAGKQGRRAREKS